MQSLVRLGLYATLPLQVQKLFPYLEPGETLPLFLLQTGNKEKKEKGK